VENVLTSWTTVSFPRRRLHNGVNVSSLYRLTDTAVSSISGYRDGTKLSGIKKVERLSLKYDRDKSGITRRRFKKIQGDWRHNDFLSPSTAAENKTRQMKFGHGRCYYCGPPFLYSMETNKQISNNICIYVNVLFSGSIFLEFSLINVRKRWNFFFTL